MTELSDDLLVAYVDRELARAQSLAVEKVLGQDEVLAARVDALKEAHRRLEAAFDAILAGATGEVMTQVPVLPPKPVGQRGNALSKVGIAIAGVGLLLAALVAGFGWPDREERVPPSSATAVAEDWRQQVLRAQLLLARASVEVSPESQANQDLVQLQLTQALGPGAKLPDLKAEGFEFVRGQLLSFMRRPLGQILYLGVARGPLAFYVAPNDDKAGDDDLAFREMGPLGAVSWSHDGVSYLLAGEEDEGTLRRLAAAIARGSSPGAATGASSPPPDPLVTGSN
jgi:anti-sigma factor RsiW